MAAHSMFRRARPISRLSTSTLVRRRPALDFSLTGVVYVAMMLFMGLAAINSQANLLFGVFGLMIGILIVSGMISRLVLRRLIVQRMLPENGCVGQPLSIVYDVTNGKRFWPSLSVSISELDGAEAFTTQPQGYMLHAAPRTTASVPAPVIPKRRGLHEFNRYQLATSFPFGFVKRAITDRHKDVMLILPPPAKVDPKLLRMCRSADVTGETVRPQPGGTDEFYGVKEYRPGDNPRWIYWRRSARSGTLISKEMTRVSPPRIAILVDTVLSSRSLADHAAIEQCIAMAASLASTALEGELSVGLCVWSGQWVAIPPTRGKRHGDDVLSLLARLPLNTVHGIEELIEAAKPILHAGTTPVLFTPRDINIDGAQDRRGGMLVIPAGSGRARSWFTFPAGIDFGACMPMDQAPADASETEAEGRPDGSRALEPSPAAAAGSASAAASFAPGISASH
jgi:uncharacterized protein (DUF58 family)